MNLKKALSIIQLYNEPIKEAITNENVNLNDKG